MVSPLQIKTHRLSQSDIKNYFEKINNSTTWYVNIKSAQLVDKIIEYWFRDNGYDFWNTPYPEVIEWQVTRNNEIIFKYIENE